MLKVETGLEKKYMFRVNMILNSESDYGSSGAQFVLLNSLLINSTIKKETENAKCKDQVYL